MIIRSCPEILEYWNVGILEYWNVGMFERIIMEYRFKREIHH